MDKARFNYLVEFTRHNFIDYKRGLWETPAKGWAYSYKILPERGDERGKMLRNLIDDSKKTKLAWDSVSLIAQEHLREGSALPPELRDWVVDVLAEKRTRPTKGAQAMSGRDRMVSLAVVHLADRFGLKPTRNIEKDKGDEESQGHCSAEGGSACDVVGKAVGRVGYKAVEQIWTNRDPLLKRRPNQNR